MMMNKEPLNHWNYFLTLVSELKNISRYVELHESNYQTFSIELTQLLLSTGAEIDVVLKEICTKITNERSPSKMKSYRSIICGSITAFPEEKVGIPLYNIELTPWQSWSTNKDPDWWTAYDQVKHHRNIYFAKANLINLLNSLAALYIAIFHLNRIIHDKKEHEYSSKLTFKYLLPRQELLALPEETYWRAVAEGLKNPMAIRKEDY